MIFAADNLNPSNPRVARALQNLDPEPISRLVIDCQTAGAQWIDVNPGYLARSKTDHMTWLVQVIQKACSLPLIIDSAQPATLRAGLEACRTPAILNALTLQAGRLAELPQLAASSGSRLVVLLLDEQGLAPGTLEQKATLAIKLHERSLAAGLSPDDLIVDPVLPNLSWPDAQEHLAASIEMVRLVSSGELLGLPLSTMAGLSNLRSGLRRRYGQELETGALADLERAGLEIVLADVLAEG